MDNYLINILFLIIVSLILNLYIRNMILSVIGVLLIYLSMSLIFYHQIKVNYEAEYYFLQAIVIVTITIASNLLLRSYHRYIDSDRPFVNIYGYRIATDKKVDLLIKLWSFTILITAAVGFFSFYKTHFFSESFYTSWAVNVVFFTIIGLAVALIGLRLPHNEEFSSRLGILFAGQPDNKVNLKQPALQDLSKSIKKLGIVASKIHRQITITEYSKDFDAFKIYVTTTTTLVNLFGDVDVEDYMNFSVSPDSFDDVPKKPKVAGQATSLYAQTDGERLSGKALDIIHVDGMKFKEKFTVGTEPVEFTFKFWVWARSKKELAYVPSRFCKQLNVVVVNRMINGTLAHVTVNNLTPPDEVGDEHLTAHKNIEDTKTLNYGERWEIGPINDVIASTRRRLCSLDISN